MIALAASDYPEAKKQARKAEKLLGSGILSDLLSAQASHGSGDRKAAERYFVSLSKNKDTNYFGYIGLMQLNKMEGNYNASVRAAKNAIKIVGVNAIKAVKSKSLERNLEPAAFRFKSRISPITR